MSERKTRQPGAGAFALGALLVLATLAGACGPSAASTTARPTQPAGGAAPGLAGAAAPASAPTPPPSATAGTMAPAAVSGAYAPQPLSPPVHVLAIDPGIIPAVPLYVAVDRGYFLEEGLDVELLLSQDATSSAQMLAVGQAAFNLAVPDPVVFNAMARGVDVKLLASATVNGPADRPAAFMVRADLIESGQYTSPADLKGLTVAVPASSSEFYIERVLSQGGLTFDDVSRVNLSLADIVAAFGSKRIEAGWEVEPLISAAVRRGLATPIAGTGQLFPGANGMDLVMASGFGRDEPEAARRFVVAYLRGMRDYYHAFNKGDGDRAAVVQSLVNHTVVKDAALYDVMGMHTVDPNGALNPASWDQWQEFYLRVGVQPQKVDLSRHVDLSYLDAALDRLGREP